MPPLVLIVGRVAAETKGVRGEPYAVGRRYLDAIERAGGVPLMLPPSPGLVARLPDVVARVDAIVLHGGGDVDPRRYGQTATAQQLYGVVHEHDEMEMAVVGEALRADLPMLAICRGLQVLNVALGGTLHQDLGDDSHWFCTHPVDVAAQSRLAHAVGGTQVVAAHCVHHQALDRVADSLAVVGRTTDGLVHACEHRTARWVVGTQWHPEDTADHDAQQQALFDTLLART